MLANTTPLRLGMKAHLGGKEYEITGRMVLATREEDEVYQWEEFQLLAASGDAAFLEFDEGRWKLLDQFVPREPLDPRELAVATKGSALTLDGARVTVTEKGWAEIRAAQGRFTFEARVGEKRYYLDARHLQSAYSVEWGEDWKADDIEYYRGRPLSEREVYTLFNLYDALAALDARSGKRRSQLLFATLCLLLSLVSFIAWGVALTSGRKVHGGEVAIATVTDDGVRSAAIQLDPKQPLHRLVIYGQMTETSAWVAGVLEAPDGQELIGTQRDFWDESGYDEGYWHESDLRAQTDFRVTQPGPYHVRLYVEPDNPSGNYRIAGYELRSGVTYPPYFLTYAIVTLLLAILFYLIGGQTKLKQLAASSD